MNTSLTRSTLRTAFIAALFLSPMARAITISASITLPNSTTAPGFNYLDDSTWPKTETNSSFGTFDFTGESYESLTSLETLSITMTFFNLDTNTDVGFDRNNITLSLAGFDTGVALNGFGNGTNTLTLSDLVSNSSSILAALQTTGSLTAGLLDATSSPSNPFLFIGGTATLSLTEAVPIPFTPSQTAGLIMMGTTTVWLRWRRMRAATTA